EAGISGIEPAQAELTIKNGQDAGKMRFECPEVISHRVLDTEVATQEGKIPDTGGATIALIDFIPGETVEAGLPGRAGVLGAAEYYVLEVVIRCRVKLGDFEIAIEAAPRIEK